MADDPSEKPNPLLVPGRRSPQQARSKKTVKLILDATLEILQGEGFYAVTMQKIADRAGINVAAVYGYFPNKYQVVAEISDRLFEERWRKREELFQRLLEKDGDWADNFADSLREIAAWRKTSFGGAMLRNAMRSSLPLLRVNRQNSDKLADQLAAFFDKVDPDYKGNQQIRARVLSESFNAVLDLIETHEGPPPPGILDELIEMIRRYLKYG